MSSAKSTATPPTAASTSGLPPAGSSPKTPTLPLPQRGREIFRRGGKIVAGIFALTTVQTCAMPALINFKLNGSSRPADECPFPRPFPEGFDQCPPFRPQPFVPMDMSYRVLPEQLTCRRLVSRPLPNGKVGW